MTRTKKYLRYFGASFFQDRTAVTLMCLIFLTIVGICVVWFALPDKNEPAPAPAATEGQQAVALQLARPSRTVLNYDEYLK